MKTSNVIPVAILIAGAIIATAVYLTVSAEQSSTIAASGNPALVRPISSTDHVLGNPSAPVQIIEYSDFDCTFCKSFDMTLRQIIADLGTSGKVAWTYRHYPITELHPNAEKHARAAECVAQAGGNDAFWKFAGLLFAGQPIDPSRYGELAQATGANPNAFATCYQNAATTVDARIAADKENGIVAGASGTPYTVLIANGKKPIVFTSAVPYSQVKAAIEQLLK